MIDPFKPIKLRIEYKDGGKWQKLTKGKDYEYAGKNIIILPPIRKKFAPKPFTITKKQWARVRYGTIFKSPNGTLRKNIKRNNTGSGCVVFAKIHSSQYPSNETVYGYNDLSHKYTIVKY